MLIAVAILIILLILTGIAVGIYFWIKTRKSDIHPDPVTPKPVIPVIPPIPLKSPIKYGDKIKLSQVFSGKTMYVAPCGRYFVFKQKNFISCGEAVSLRPGNTEGMILTVGGGNTGDIVGQNSFTLNNLDKCSVTDSDSGVTPLIYSPSNSSIKFKFDPMSGQSFTNNTNGYIYSADDETFILSAIFPLTQQDQNCPSDLCFLRGKQASTKDIQTWFFTTDFPKPDPEPAHVLPPPPPVAQPAPVVDSFNGTYFIRNLDDEYITVCGRSVIGKKCDNAITLTTDKSKALQCLLVASDNSSGQIGDKSFSIYIAGKQMQGTAFMAKCDAGLDGTQTPVYSTYSLPLSLTFNYKQVSGKGFNTETPGYLVEKSGLRLSSRVGNPDATDVCPADLILEPGNDTLMHQQWIFESQY